MITLQRLSAASGGSKTGRNYLRYLRNLKSQSEQLGVRPEAFDEYIQPSNQVWIVAGKTDAPSLVTDRSLVTAEAFMRLCEGKHPATGEVLGYQAKKRSPGIDMCFSTPKGISTLWAVADQKTRLIMERLLHEASRETLNYAMEEGWFETRRGSGSQDTVCHEAVAQIQAASFTHYTNRAGEPSLHQHTVIMNMARTKDGRYLALEPSEILHQQKVLSAHFDASVAYKLSKELGISFDANGANAIDVAGMPKPLSEELSSRSKAIKELAGDHASQKQLDRAWARTRPDKGKIASAEQLEENWKKIILNHLPMERDFAARPPTIDPVALQKDVQRYLLAERVKALHRPNQETYKKLHESTDFEFSEEKFDRDGLANSIRMHQIKENIRRDQARRESDAPLPEYAIQSVAPDRETFDALVSFCDYEAARSKRMKADAIKKPKSKEEYILRDKEREEAAIQREAQALLGPNYKHMSIENQILAEALARGMRHASAIDQRDHLQKAFLIGATKQIDPDQIRAAYHNFTQLPNIIHGKVVSEDVTIEHERFGVSSLFAAHEEATIRRVAASGVGKLADISSHADMYQPGATLSEEQIEAVRHVLKGNQISVIEGFAGAGKTSSANILLNCARAAGLRPLLIASSWKASQVLQGDTGIETVPIQTLLADKEKLGEIDDKTFILFDEAAMASREDVAKLSAVIEKKDARGVYQGDRQQLQSPGGGSPLQIVADEVEFATLKTIRRQKHEWMREASIKMATKKSHEAMEMYHARGKVTFAADRDAMIDAAADKYVAFNEVGSVMAIARTRNEVHDLNKAIRKRLVGNGNLAEVLGTEVARQTMSGDHEIIVDIEIRRGDKIRIGEKVDRYGIVTGDVATVLGREEDGRYILHTEGKPPVRVTWDQLSNTNWFEKQKAKRNPNSRSKPAVAAPRVVHAFATTIHSSQGSTVDRAVVMQGVIFDGRDMYVAGTRHKEDLAIIVDQDMIERSIRKSNKKKELLGEDVSELEEGEEKDNKIFKRWWGQLRHFSRNINVGDLIRSLELLEEQKHEREHRRYLIGKDGRDQASARGIADDVTGNRDSGPDRHDRGSDDGNPSRREETVGPGRGGIGSPNGSHHGNPTHADGAQSQGRRDQPSRVQGRGISR